MEWSIPIQTFEPSKVKLGPMYRANKWMTPLAYTDDELHFLALTLVLPLLTVNSYDAASGRLVLSLRDSVTTRVKLNALQEMILKAVGAQQGVWFSRERIRSPEELRSGFQPMVDGDMLHLYCPSGTANPDIAVFSTGVWSQGVRGGMLSAGAKVRIVLRIQGASFHQQLDTGYWSGKFRLQHRILTIFHHGG